jgi:hypothetical protein
MLTWRDTKILGRDCPKVSWKWIASFSTGTTAITASSMRATVPVSNRYEHKDRKKKKIHDQTGGLNLSSFSSRV